MKIRLFQILTEILAHRASKAFSRTLGKSRLAYVSLVPSKAHLLLGRTVVSMILERVGA